MEQQVASRGFSRQTIIKNIKYKLNGWYTSIEKSLTDGIDDKKDKEEASKKAKEFCKLIDDHVIVTGGAIASMLQGQLPNDYDIYFDNAQVASTVAEFYLNRLKKTDKVSVMNAQVNEEENRVTIMIKSAGIGSEEVDQDEYDYFELRSPSAAAEYLEKYQFSSNNKKDYAVINITSNAITLSSQLQIILRFVGDPEAIHHNFDYVHCTNYWSKATGLVLKQAALEAIMSKRLEYCGSLFPICSVFRIRKFIRRGWTITAGEILKICWDIHKLNLSDRLVLQEQLIGVDAAYFEQVFRILDQEKNKELDRTYLFEIINRVFNEDDDEELHQPSSNSTNHDER